MTYQNIRVEPIAPALGAIVSGADLKNLNQETFSEIHRAFLEHLVVFFPDQDLDIEDLKGFARRFGPLLVDPIVKAAEGQPEVLEVVKEKHEKKAFGENWHSDSTYWEKPPLGSFLYAKEIPPVGGDTMFANQYLAYETLSQGIRDAIDELKGVHRPTNYEYGLTNGTYTLERKMQLRRDETMWENITKEVVHPIVRTHPETGRKALFCNNSYTRRIDGWTPEESLPLLNFLQQHSIRPEFTCRYRWTPGAVALWDNRCAMHRPINDYHGYRRLMYRVVAEGDRPV